MRAAYEMRWFEVSMAEERLASSIVGEEHYVLPNFTKGGNHDQVLCVNVSLPEPQSFCGTAA